MLECEEGDWRLLHPLLRRVSHIQAIAARNVEILDDTRQLTLYVNNCQYTCQSDTRNPNWIWNYYNNNITNQLNIHIDNSNINIDTPLNTLYHIQKEQVTTYNINYTTN